MVTQQFAPLILRGAGSSRASGSYYNLQTFMIKVVIDTNLLIDGSEDFFNFANRIIDLVIAGQIEAYANHQTLRENMFLAEKKITDEGYLKKLKFFFAAVHPVETKITT